MAREYSLAETRDGWMVGEGQISRTAVAESIAQFREKLKRAERAAQYLRALYKSWADR
jgi:hypothetical protein